MKKIIILILFTAIVYVQALTLQESGQFALKNNFDIQNSILAFKQNQMDQLKTLSMYIPQLSGSYTKNSLNQPSVSQIFSSYPIEANGFTPSVSMLLPGGGSIKAEYSYQYSQSTPMNNPMFPSSSPDSYTAQYTISFNQPLLQNFLFIPQDVNIIRMAKHSKEIARDMIYQASENILLNTYITYVNLIISKLNVEVKNNSFKRAQTLLSKNLKNKSLGIVENTDILGSRAALAQRTSDLLSSQGNVKNVLNQLKNLMNQKENLSLEDFKLNLEKLSLFGNNMVTNLEEAKRIAYSNNIGLNILYEQQKLQKLNVQNVSSKIMPQLNLFGNYGYYGNADTEEDALQALSDKKYKNWTIGLNLSMPLFPAGSIAELKKQKAELQKIQNNIAKTKLQIETQLKDKIRDVKIAKDSMLAMKKNKQYQNQKLSEEEKKYKIGRSSNRVIIMYQDDVENAETYYLQSLLRYYISLFSLDYAEGLLVKKYAPDFYDSISKLK